MPIVQSLGPRRPAHKAPGESLPGKYFIRSRWVMPVEPCQENGRGPEASLKKAIQAALSWLKCGVKTQLGASRLPHGTGDKVHCGKAGIMV
jgi:hypothetical protein